MNESRIECHKCREPIVWDSHIIGKEQWLHIRTSSHICKPVCATCGKPATHRVGAVGVAGDGTLTFRTHKYVCDDCDRGSMRISYE